MRQTQLSEFFRVSPKLTNRPNKKKNYLTGTSPAKQLTMFKQNRRSLNTSIRATQSTTEVSPTQIDNKMTIDSNIKIKIEDNDEITIDNEIFVRQFNFNDEDDDGLPNDDVYPKEFDLENIYKEKKFTAEYGAVISAMSASILKLRCAKDKHVERLWTAIIDVFSVSMNCVYFNRSELILVKKMATMTSDAQIVLARLLKWKPGWYRVKKMSEKLEMNISIDILRELIDHKLFECDYTNEELDTLLDLLLVDEVKEICKKMKVPHTTAKPTMILQLLKISNKKKSIFVGIKTPSEVLRKNVENAVGQCVRVSDMCWNLIKRIITLLYPIQDASETFPDVFRMLNDVHYGDRIYPDMPKERFPIFRDRQALMDYAEAKNSLFGVTDAIAKKQWDIVRQIGHLAYQHLDKYLKQSKTDLKSQIPSHVRRFASSYVWVKILWTSIEAFKKDREQDHATEYLKFLIINRKRLRGRYGQWYAELALIEMSHNKNLEASVLVVETGLNNEILTLTDTAELLERARKLAARKTGICENSRKRMKEILENYGNSFICVPPEIAISAIKMEHGISSGPKSVWRIDNETERVYVNVEDVALRHYQNNGYKCGLHLEGRLPVTLFASLFWDEIYTISVPGAFVCQYQTAPLDLFGSQFWANRQDRMDTRIEFMKNLDIESLCDIMEYNFVTSREYFSLLSSNGIENKEDLKCIIKCLGAKPVIGICTLIAENYCQWSAGFPDLIVWNPTELKCKVVEVKGPGDTLSIKQKLWINELIRIGVEFELCNVKSKHQL